MIPEFPGSEVEEYSLQVCGVVRSWVEQNICSRFLRPLVLEGIKTTPYQD